MSSRSSPSSPGRPRRSPPKATTTPRRGSSHPPRNTHDDNVGPTQTQTPANNTNFRASAPPSSSHARYSVRTPGNQVLDPNFRTSRQQHFSASVGRAGKINNNYIYHAPTQFTPHGRAAIRALDSRRAAIDQINTPGRNRRRSMRDQRETPRDVLRALSKTLAPKSKPITTTSSSSSSPGDAPGTSSRPRRRRRHPVVIPEDPGGGGDDSDDEFPIDRPRFSLPIDEDADSDGDLPRPPRSSGLEDLEDNYTMQSIEMPRRATLGLGPGQRDRFSMRMSMMGDPQSDDGGVGIDPAFFPRANWDDDDNDGDDNTRGRDGDDDATLERLDEDDEAARRGTLGGRISDFGAIDFDLDAGDQSTVVLAPQVRSSPAREDFSPENEPFGFDYDDQPPAFGDGEEDVGADGDGGDDRSRATHMDLDLGADDDDGEDDSTEETGGGGDPTATGDLLDVGQTSSKSAAAGGLRRPGKKAPRHGIAYPSLPAGVVKRLAQRFAGRTSKIGPDALAAVAQASDWFFEQLGEDLRAYANHARGRTTINESDMLTLMRRYVVSRSFIPSIFFLLRLLIYSVLVLVLFQSRTNTDRYTDKRVSSPLGGVFVHLCSLTDTFPPAQTTADERFHYTLCARPETPAQGAHPGATHADLGAGEDEAAEACCRRRRGRGGRRRDVSNGKGKRGSGLGNQRFTFRVNEHVVGVGGCVIIIIVIITTVCSYARVWRHRMGAS